MSIKMKYAYLNNQTWMYRRHYPKDVQVLLGTKCLKQTLKTSDVKEARSRIVEANSRFEDIVRKARAGVEGVEVGNLSTVPTSLSPAATPEEIWEEASKATAAALRATLAGERVKLDPVVFLTAAEKEKHKTVSEVAEIYRRKRSAEMRPSGYKSVKYMLRLFVSKYGDTPTPHLVRDDGKWYLSAIKELSPHVAKSYRSTGLGLDALLELSQYDHRKIAVPTQKRIWRQTNHFLNWAVYEGHLESNPFQKVRFDGKTRYASFAVPTDDEVKVLLTQRQSRSYPVLVFALLSGMRSGEIVGLEREDIIDKGNLGQFIRIRPNDQRLLKTEAAERSVPVHVDLVELLKDLPKSGLLFPQVDVSKVTKDFRDWRKNLPIDRAGLVFHSTRKWFITQCERTGVPEHFTASIVGHKSARSENGMTYGIYSAGISDEQKRGIIDQIRLPL